MAAVRPIAGQRINCGQTVTGSTSGRPSQYGNAAGDAFYDFTVYRGSTFTFNSVRFGI